MLIPILVLAYGLEVAAEVSSTLLSADAIINKAVARAAHVQASPPGAGYTYLKTNVTEELDTRGNVKQRKERVFQVYFLAGATHVKLLEVNGGPPGTADIKLQADTQSHVHRFLGQPAEGGDSRENFLTPELTARFDYTLAGQSRLNSRPAYRIEFRPKTPPLPTRRILDRVLDHLSGTLWIDTEEYEVARVDFQLRSEVDFLGGVIGCLRKVGYSLTRVRLADGVWLHSRSRGDFEGRKLLDSLHIKMRSESTDFRLLSAGP